MKIKIEIDTALDTTATLALFEKHFMNNDKVSLSVGNKKFKLHFIGNGEKIVEPGTIKGSFVLST